MLTDKLRPSNWSEVCGQKENIKILRALIKNPENSPKTIILEGEFGTGKTTLARIFAKELNNIKDPNYDLNQSPFYYEYDSAIIGNVEEIRKLRDVFGIGFEDYWKVVVFDECHGVSQQAQNALLKILEEVKTKTFFLLCTTHVHKVIPTIRSRSLELSFGTASVDEVVEHLSLVAIALGIYIPTEIKELIAHRSHGHMRNVHMLLDKFCIIGDESFMETVISSVDLFCDYFIAIKQNNEKNVLKYINMLLEVPIVNLKEDFSDFLTKGMKCFNNLPVGNIKIEQLIKLYGSDYLKIIKNFYSEWMRYLFDSDYHFQCGMLYFFHILKVDMNIRKVTTPAESNPLKAR
jgi:DNA polymerase-3 subunit gamma/tau